MKVKAEEHKQRHFQFLPRKARGYTGRQQGKADVMPEHVMIVTPPGHWRGAVAREYFRDDSEPVRVRYDAGPRDESTLAFRERRRGVCNRPAHHQMRYRAHAAKESRPRAPVQKRRQNFPECRTSADVTPTCPESGFPRQPVGRRYRLLAT